MLPLPVVCRYRNSIGCAAAVVALAAVHIIAAPAEAWADGDPPVGAVALQAAQTRYWLGVDGAPLPFRSDAEILEFLRTADIVESEQLPIGVTRPEKVVLEKDGIRVYGVFRHYEVVYDRDRMGRTVYVNFRDSFRFETAAYELAGLLGMDNVPPTVERRIGDRNGTLQMWVYNALMESERIEQGLAPPGNGRWTRQWKQMRVFDCLVGNVDRNAGNILIDGNWKIWLIDHSRAFYARAGYDDLEEVDVIGRAFWERLRSLEREQLDEALGDSLSGSEIGRLLDRRDKVVEYVFKLIAEHGEENVVYGSG